MLNRRVASLFLARIACHIGVSILFAVLVMIMGALVAAKTGLFFTYGPFGIAVAILTLMTLPVMCVP